jgi:hypothetical protein
VLRHIYRKLDARGRRDALRRAKELNLLFDGLLEPLGPAAIRSTDSALPKLRTSGSQFGREAYLLAVSPCLGCC